MGMNYGEIVSVSIGTNKDGAEQVRLAQVAVYDNDTITVEIRSQPGEDYNPPVGSFVFFGDVTDTYSVSTATADKVAPASDLEEGERELYSVEDKKRKAKLRFKKNGDLVHNDGTGAAVEIARLKAKIDELQGNINANTEKINLHVHLGNVGAPTGTMITALQTPISLDETNVDITDAKSETVKIP
jgi:hypothetical protein